MPGRGDRGRGSGVSPSALPCPHYPHCVGCAFIGRPYGEQLLLKQQRVRDAFSRFPSLAEVSVPAVVGSPRAFGYRNQAKLVVRRSERGLLLGIYRPQSHQVVDISQCPVHHPLINSVLAKLREILERFDVAIYDERTHTGNLRYVVVRVSNWTKRAQIILVTRDRVLPQARPLVARLQRVPGVVSVVQNINPEPGNVIFGPSFVPLTRETALVERVGLLKLQTQAGAFLQANIPVARKLYECALAWAAPAADDVAIDLYCGAGALTFHLATAAKHVSGIEESPLAIIDAKRNVRLNGFHNLRFFAGEVTSMLPELAARLPRIDVITLNPPRKGVEAAALTAILACASRRLVYISCNPDTLARDLDWFATQGYHVRRVQPFDLLPQTDHVECVALLERENSDPLCY
jgi:23S rRNA (uracil1939-C5)-methyltransferase